MNPITRRTLLAALLAAPAVAIRAQETLPTVAVWKDVSCGCCDDWITHLEKAGFRVKSYNTGNRTKRTELGMPNRYASCHTALVAGYIVEGHVPAADIQRLLKERPKALGLAVPNMPNGSPGMDGPAYGGRTEPYDVLLVATDGSSRVFASHGKERRK